MENQEDPSLKLRQPLSMLGIIKETMNTINRNMKPMKVILYFVILTDIQFHVATSYNMEVSHKEHFVIHITNHHVNSNGFNMREDVAREVHEQLMTKFHIVVCSCCLFLYFAITTILSSYESYIGNTLSIMGVILKVSKNWKRPLLTSGCILFITSGMYVVYGFSIAVISFLAGRSHVDSLSLFYIEALRWICFAYVAALSMMSLVVSVLEDNISGFKAITRASDLMKGKQIQASIVMMLYHTACLGTGKFIKVWLMTLQEWLYEEWTMWAIEIFFVAGFTSLFRVFVFVFYTVLYHECKNGPENDDGIVGSHSAEDKYS